MSEILKTDNLAKAIRLLPNPKNYPPETVSVMVEKIKYNFTKIKNSWHFIL
jgi:hypothetical protein